MPGHRSQVSPLWGLDWSASLDNPDQDHDDRRDEQQMNESADRIRADKSESPEQKQDDCDGPKHVVVL